MYLMKIHPLEVEDLAYVGSGPEIKKKISNG